MEIQLRRVKLKTGEGIYDKEDSTTTSERWRWNRNRPGQGPFLLFFGASVLFLVVVLLSSNVVGAQLDLPSMPGPPYPDPKGNNRWGVKFDPRKHGPPFDKRESSQQRNRHSRLQLSNERHRLHNSFGPLMRDSFWSPAKMRNHASRPMRNERRGKRRNRLFGIRRRKPRLPHHHHHHHKPKPYQTEDDDVEEDEDLEHENDNSWRPFTKNGNKLPFNIKWKGNTQGKNNIPPPPTYPATVAITKTKYPSKEEEQRFWKTWNNWYENQADGIAKEKFRPGSKAPIFEETASKSPPLSSYKSTGGAGGLADRWKVTRSHYSNVVRNAYERAKSYSPITIEVDMGENDDGSTRDGQESYKDVSKGASGLRMFTAIGKGLDAANDVMGSVRKTIGGTVVGTGIKYGGKMAMGAMMNVGTSALTTAIKSATGALG